jgi:hypothetical protein
MKLVFYIVVPLLLVVVTGCASTANPIFNSSVKKAYIYSAYENQEMGTPDIMRGATGEVRYCQGGLPQLVKARQKEAYDAIAEACGGDDQYIITGELMADASSPFMGVDFQCVGNSGRAIIFKCKNKKPQPTGYSK